MRKFQKYDSENEIGLFMNISVNVGDSLNSIPIWRVKTTRQQIKPDPQGRSLRTRFLKEGLGHSFYEGFLWVVTINGKSINEVDLIRLVSKNFMKLGESKIEEIENFTSDKLWYPVSLVLLRDALRYSLKEKIKNKKDFDINLRTVYDRSNIVYTGRIFYVALGVSFEKIFRINHNVAISPELDYECYDTLNRRVEDPYYRQIGIFYASRCDPKICLLYTSPSPRDLSTSRMPSSA